MIRTDDRGVSDVIGFILVFGLVATTTAVISVNGLSVLQDTRNAEQVNNAERAFDVLADNLEDVYQEGAPHRATEISLEKARLNTATTARINVSGVDGSGDMTSVINLQTQPIVWEGERTDGTQIAYELGAVVRSDRQGGVVVNDPPFVLDRERMLFMVVDTQTNSPKSLSGTTIRVRGNRGLSRGAIYDFKNDYDEMRVNVTSPRATVWKRYLEQKDITRTDSCSIDDNEGTARVSCVLDPPEKLYVTISTVGIELER